MDEDTRRLQDFITSLSARARPVTIVRKGDHGLQRAIDKALRLLTLGGQSRYLTDYVTTLGHTIYVPDDWDETTPARERYKTLRHELIHVKQFECWGWAGMVVLYGLVYFPVGLAYGRARLEWEAYAETIRVTAELDGLDAAASPRLKRWIVERFTGPDYAWMWPFPAQVGGWVDALLVELARNAGG